MRNSDKILSIISSMGDKPTVNINYYDKVADGFFAIAFSIPLNNDFGFKEFNESLAGITQNHFLMEPNTLVPIDNGEKSHKHFRCIAHANVESMPFNDENVKGMAPIKANVFWQEDRDVIWRLVGTDKEEKRLVRVSKEDYDAILEAKRSRNPVISSICSSPDYMEGDYAYFFNSKTLAMDFGFVVERDGKDYVFSRSAEDLVPLEAAQIIIANMIEPHKNPVKEKQRMLAAKDYSLKGYLDYLRKLYGADNPYYKAMEKAMKEYTVQ